MILQGIGQRWLTRWATRRTDTDMTYSFDQFSRLMGHKVRETSDGSGSTITTYYLRLSVLGGAIVEELTSSG